MNAAFLGQWKLYRRGALRPALVGLEPRTEGEFDRGVAVGETRVFADTTSPLVALVVEGRGLSGWRIVPVSPFCAPASDRETIVGERVLQLWNATVVSRRFAERSWIVDTIAGEEVGRVRGAIAAARPGIVASGDGVQAKYEREFLIGEGNLVPFAEPPVPDEARRLAWVRPALLAAASLAICIGAWILVEPASLRRVADGWRAGWMEVSVAEDGPSIELVEATEPVESGTEIAEVDIDFTPDSAKWYGSMPEPRVVQVPKFADVKGPKMPEGLPKITPKGVQFKSPVDVPMDVVFLASDEPCESRPSAGVGGGISYGSFARPLERMPDVRCVLGHGEGPDAVLRIVGKGADGVKVTVVFDQETVEGYRRVVDGLEDGVLAKYALMSFAGKEIGAKSVTAALIWPSLDGDVRTPLVL